MQPTVIKVTTECVSRKDVVFVDVVISGDINMLEVPLIEGNFLMVLSFSVLKTSPIKAATADTPFHGYVKT